MIRLIANTLAGLKTALGITSPSREFLAAVRAAECRPHVALVPLSWYAARGPGEPWSSAAKRRNARLTRRAMRRDTDPWSWLDRGAS